MVPCGHQLCADRSEAETVVLMYVTWEQLIAFGLLLATIIGVCLKNKDR
jgi:hypothetical protein